MWKYLGIYYLLKAVYRGHLSKTWNSSVSVHLRSFLKFWEYIMAKPLYIEPLHVKYIYISQQTWSDGWVQQVSLICFMAKWLNDNTSLLVIVNLHYIRQWRKTMYMYIVAYGTRISTSTSGAAKCHFTPPCKTSRVRWRHDIFLALLLYKIAFILLGFRRKQ